MKNLENLEKTIKFEFKNKALLIEALTHRSYLNENKDYKGSNNERLEFLGDAVLELVVTQYLFKKYTQLPEGILTSIRSSLVRTESLAAEALKIKLGEYILMSNGEEVTGGRERPYILANTMEALIGAIYLDRGMTASTTFVTEQIIYKAQEVIDNKLYIDAKSRLQEVIQEEFKITPNYVLKSATGPDHHKTFVMAAMVGEHQISEGSGESKQNAEQQAAETALKNWEEINTKLSKIIK